MLDNPESRFPICSEGLGRGCVSRSRLRFPWPYAFSDFSTFLKAARLLEAQICPSLTPSHIISSRVILVVPQLPPSSTFRIVPAAARFLTNTNHTTASFQLVKQLPSSTTTMSRTRPTPSLLPADSGVGFVASLFRSTACIEEAFHQESGELRYLEKCWSDSAVLQFILIGWIGLALKVLLFVLLISFLVACIQGRRPWYVFMSFVKGTGRVLGGLCSCFEMEGEVRQGDAAGDTETGLGIVWQEEKEGGGYFGSSKEKDFDRN